MAWIDTIREDEWEGALAELYGAVVDRDHDRVDNILQIHSLDPKGVAAHQGLYTTAMSGTGTLRKVERELIALVVSSLNECHYLLTHHRRGLRRLLKDDDLLTAIETDWRTAGLSERRLAMLGYAEKLTTTPGRMSASDVASLRQAGFTDRDILDIATVTAYYAYANRIADGLGVQLETWIDD